MTEARLRFLSRARSLPGVLLITALFGAARPAAAFYEVVYRPLEKAPYTREIEHPVYLNIGPKSVLEGSGIVLTSLPSGTPGPGAPVGFDLPKFDQRPHELEFQLGYLVKTASYDRTQRCSVEMRTRRAGDWKSRRLEVPLRSLDTESFDFDEVARAYDYWAPSFKISVRDATTAATTTAAAIGPAIDRVEFTAPNCPAGEVVLLDPKVWRRTNDLPARRLLVLVTDSLGHEWFEGSRRFMPAVQDFFAPPSGFGFNTQVVSPSTNTGQTTDILVRQRYFNRDETTRREAPAFTYRDDVAVGLVPAFLNAGYDAYASISNYFATHRVSQSGFRNVFQIDIAGGAMQSRNDEYRSLMMRDYIRRHPEHNALLFMWFDSSHAWIKPPRFRPDFVAKNLPYRAGTVRSREFIELQAQGASFVDLSLEPLLRDPLLAETDTMFLSDHGIHYNSLRYPLPMWPACLGEKQPNNNSLIPQEFRIFTAFRPAAFHRHETPSPRWVTPDVESSTLDWFYSVARIYHPTVDTSGWQGRMLSELRPNSPILSFAHYQRAVMRQAGHDLLWTEKSCTPPAASSMTSAAPLPTVLREDGVTPATPAQRSALWQALDRFEIGPYRRLDFEFHGRDETCGVRVQLGSGGAESPARLRVDFKSGQWFQRQTRYLAEYIVQELARLDSPASVFELEDRPRGCARVHVGFLDRPAPARLDFDGLQAAIEYPISNFALARRSTLTITAPAGRYLSHGHGELVPYVAPRTSVKISADLKQAMKAWGYIQDEDAH